MKPFRFRLQTLLNVAQQHERGIKHEFARLQNHEHEIQTHLEATARNWMDWEERLRQTQQGHLDIERVKAHLQVVKMLQQRINQCRVELETARQMTAQIQKQLTEAARERRTLERLREKQHTEHTAARAAEEVKITDDLVSARAATARNNTMTGVPA